MPVTLPNSYRDGMWSGTRNRGLSGRSGEFFLGADDEELGHNSMT